MSHTHILTLQPSDVLFFKDGRPMEGASSGNGAAWPMPNVLDSAIHAALHRAESSLKSIHRHTPGRSQQERDYSDENRANNGRVFGSLQTAGPFPVIHDTWYFPRPSDADSGSIASATHKPLQTLPSGTDSTLEKGLLPVVNTQPPSKETPEKWMSLDAYQAYLEGKEFLETEPDKENKIHYLNDEQIFATEHNIGIGIDPTTGTQDGKSFYSASYLRLEENARLGLINNCQDKQAGDIIESVFPNSGATTRILAGGQQRTCGVKRKTPEKLPLPIAPTIEGNLVRWTLLTPAIFPTLTKTDQHPGGWLPTWIDPESKEVKLKTRPQRNAGESRSDWRERVIKQPFIEAKLVAAMIPRPIPITGWSLGHYDNQGGAKSTHLAVPAGAVYYFEAKDETEARKLADALNWHGSQTDNPNTIINRRSSLMGEKGFGLGVCSPFSYHKA